jgi:hypothetical protein
MYRDSLEGRHEVCGDLCQEGDQDCGDFSFETDISSRLMNPFTSFETLPDHIRGHGPLGWQILVKKARAEFFDGVSYVPLVDGKDVNSLFRSLRPSLRRMGFEIRRTYSAQWWLKFSGRSIALQRSQHQQSFRPVNCLVQLLHDVSVIRTL